MGERANEIAPYQDDNRANDVPSMAGDDADQRSEVILAGIEHTRSEMSQTIDAIQDKLNPQVVMQQAKVTVIETATELMDHAKDSAMQAVDHAKEAAQTTATELMDHAKDSAVEAVDHAKQATQETATRLVDHAKESAVEAVDHTKQTVHDATVGKVEHMVSNVSNAAQETGSGIVTTIKNNPIPAALVGLGLGWFFMKGQGQSKSASNTMRSSKPTTYSTGGNDFGQRRSSFDYSNNDDAYYRAANRLDQPNSEGVLNQVVDVMRQNPVPTAMAGLGIGYLVMQGQNTSKQTSRPSSNSTGYYQSEDMGQKVSNLAEGAKDKVVSTAQQAGDVASSVVGQAGHLVGQTGEKVGDLAGGVTEKVGDIAGGVTGKVGDIASGVTGKVGDLAGGIGDLAGGVGGKVGDLAGGVGDAIGGVVTGVQYQTQRTEGQFEQLLLEKPLAVGAAALVLGMTVGFILPKTEQEDRLLGEARDTVVGKAEQIAQETFEKVQQVTEEVGSTAKQAIDEVADTAKKEAHNTGLTK